MRRAGSGIAFLLLAGTAVFAGFVAAAAALAGLVGSATIYAQPVLGTYALVAMAQLDGITLLIDRQLPISTFKIVSILLLVALILTLPRNKVLSAGPHPSLPMMFSLLFAIWLVFSFLLSDYREHAREHTFDFLQTMLMAVFISLTVASTTHLRRLALIIGASGAISAVFVILETVAGIRLLPHANINDIADWRGAVRSGGASAYNPTTSAHLMVVSFMISLTMAAYDRAARRLWLVFAALCMVALPMMGARSAVLAQIAGVCFLLFALRKHRHFPAILIGLGVTVLVVLPLVPASLWEKFNVLSDFFEGGNTSDRTLLRRMTYYLIGFEQWAQNPVAGIGPGAFSAVFAGDEYRWFPGWDARERQLHNAFLEVAAETGLVGLFLFLAAVLGAAGGALRQGFRATSEVCILARAFGIAMAAFLVASFFMPNEDNKYMWIMTALCGRAALLCSGGFQKGGPSS